MSTSAHQWSARLRPLLVLILTLTCTYARLRLRPVITTTGIILRGIITSITSKSIPTGRILPIGLIPSPAIVTRGHGIDCTLHLGNVILRD